MMFGNNSWGRGGRGLMGLAALGYRRPGAFPVSGCGFLPRRGLLRPRLRREQRQELRGSRQLEG
jgi:hypothetical protein